MIDYSIQYDLLRYFFAAVSLENDIWQDVRVFLGLFCHQEPSILVKIDGRLIPLCPRCIGLHVGVTLGSIVMMHKTRTRMVILRKGMFAVLVLAVAGMIGHWFTGKLDLVGMDSFSRLVTGVVCGSSLSVLFTKYKNELTHSINTRFREIGIIDISTVISIPLVVSVVCVLYAGRYVVISIGVVSVLVNLCLAFQVLFRIARVRLFPKPYYRIIYNLQKGVCQ